MTRNRHIGYLALLYACLIGPLNVSAREAQNPLVALSHLTYQSNKGCVAAVIHLSGPLKFLQRRLQHPERFYIDLKNARVGVGFKRLYPVDKNLVKTIRASQFDADTVRVVFDLRSDKCDVEAVFLKNPCRIAVHICTKHEDHQVRDRCFSHVTGSFIPKENWITDFEARLALARILSYDDITLNESLKEYRILLKQKPEDRLVSLEMAGVLIRKGDAEEALSILGRIRALHPNDPETLVAMADLESSLGHAAKSRDLYTDAIRVSNRPGILKLQLADRMNMWGDFHKVENIYRENLSVHPEDRSAALRLAALLRSSERYGESEGMFKGMLVESPDSKEALMGLAQVKHLEKNFDAAEKSVDRLLTLDPDAPEGLQLKADILFLQKRYEDALSIYSRLSKMKCCRVNGLLGMGKVYVEQGKEDIAQTCFEEALEAAPQDVETRFYAAGADKATSENFVNALLEDKDTSAMTLGQWARLYATQGVNKIAIKCYESSLERDPEYFPSQIGLAEILAIDHQYDSSIKRFEALAKAFPGNRKILIGWARTLAWGRRYDESIALYEKIHGIAPADPVPRMEKARTAVWAKEMGLASEAYEGLLSPPVDKALALSLKPVAEASGNPDLMSLLGNGRKSLAFRRLL